MKNQKFRIIIGVFLSIIAIIIIISIVNFHDVWMNLKKLSGVTIISVLFLYLINMAIRTVRWKIIISQRAGFGFYIVFKALTYGFMLNQLLPAKAGELGRAEYLTRKCKNSRSFLLGTIIVERIFDMIVIFLFMIFSVLFSETLISILQSNIVSLIVLLCSVSISVIILFNIHLIKRITQHLPVKLQLLLNNIADNLQRSFTLFKSYKVVLKVFLISFVIWGLTSYTFYLILSDLDIYLPFYAYFFVVSAGTFGMIIPSASGNIGVYHAVTMGALMVFMIPKAEAITFAIIAHAFDFIPSVLLGGVIFGYGRLIDLKKKKNFEIDVAKN